MYYNIPLSQKGLSQRKLEEYHKYSMVINEGRKNPVWFIEEFFGIKLFDYQKWMLMNSWSRPFVLWLNCRGAGKTALAAIYYQAKLLLVPDYRVFISALTLAQSIDTFKKLEEIALQKIPHFKTCTDLFAQELERSSSSETGFLHPPSGYKFNLWNNSGMLTLSSNLDALRGKRGSVFYDETAWQTPEQMAVTENFINVDSSFGLGVGEVQRLEPIQMPLQLLYASSAGDVSYPFFEKYKFFSKKMFLGDPNYFACDLNVDTVMSFSTVDGKPHKSHLTREQIEKAIEEDPDLADRELYNLFRRGAGENAIVKMETLIRNSSPYLPVFYNDTGKRKFIFCYDPARNFDGSILSVWEVINDPNIGFKLRLVNVIAMVDQESIGKTPLAMPEQLKIIKRLLLNYNGPRAAEYENIEFYIDAGAGGGGISAVADSLLSDWTDEDGVEHVGIIDGVHKQYETSRSKYTHARPIVHLIEPKSHRQIIFNSLEKMTRHDLMEFPEYDNNKDSILVSDESGHLEEIVLSEEEQIALTQCNLLKNEMIYMCRYETPNGGVQYDLAKDKKNRLHDDRVYTSALAAYALSQMRRTDLTTVRDDLDLLSVQPSVTVINFD